MLVLIYRMWNMCRRRYIGDKVYVVLIYMLIVLGIILVIGGKEIFYIVKNLYVIFEGY